MSGGEVEPWIWKAAVAATKRYYSGLWGRGGPTDHLSYRTGYIMGYRAGVRLGKRRARVGKEPAK